MQLATSQPNRNEAINMQASEELAQAAQALQDDFDSNQETDGKSEKSENDNLFEPTEYLKDLQKNISDKQIQELYEALEEIDAQRAALNNQRASLLQAHVDKGATKRGINAGFQRYKEKSKKDQAKTDATFARYTRAVGKGYQSELF